MKNFANVLSLLQKIRAEARSLADDSIEQGLLDLQGHLLYLQVQSLEQQVENRALKQETVQLRACLKTARKLERVHDSYYHVQSAHDVRGPFCGACWDRRDQLQPLLESGDTTGYCPICKCKVQTGAPQQFGERRKRAVNE